MSIQSRVRKLEARFLPDCERERREAQAAEFNKWLAEKIAHLPEATFTELAEELRGMDALWDNDYRSAAETYALPYPFSTRLLPEGTVYRAMMLAGQLKMGELTTDQHAAELAAILPPAPTRDELEALVREELCALLGGNLDAIGEQRP